MPKDYPKCGNIELGDEIGSGGYGTVYHIKRKGKIDPNNVIKVLHDKRTVKGKSKYRSIKYFSSLLEIDVLFRLKTDSLTKGSNIYAVGDCSILNSVAIEMEALKDFKNLLFDNEIDPIQKILFMYKIATNIKCLHSRKILHLDIKPANMLYKIKNGIPLIKLADFGLSYQVDDIDLGFYSNNSFGSRKYKPPESLEVVRLSDDKYKKISDDPAFDKFYDSLSFNYTSKFDVWSYGISCLNILESGPDKNLMTDDWDDMSYNVFCDTIANKFSPTNKQATLENVISPLKLGDRTNRLLMDLLLKIFELNPEKRIEFKEIVKHRLFSETLFDKKTPINQVFKDEKCGVEDELICNYEKFNPSMIGGLRYIINIFKGPLKETYARDLFFALDIYVRIIIASRTKNWSVCKKTAILATRIAFRYYYPRSDFELKEHSDEEYEPLEAPVLKLFKGSIRVTNLYDLATYADHLKVFYDKMIENDYDGFNYYLIIDYQNLLSKIDKDYIIENNNKIIKCKDFFDLKVSSNRAYEKNQPGYKEVESNYVSKKVKELNKMRNESSY